jgi:hypothetical protein
MKKRRIFRFFIRVRERSEGIETIDRAKIELLQ